MTGWVWAVAGCAFAAALLVLPPRGWERYRVAGGPVSSGREPKWLGVNKPRPDAFAAAASYELFALCLRVGMPVASAATVVADSAPPELRATLSRTAELLTLGADPAAAWTIDESAPESARALATLARRSARAGSSPAGGLSELAEAERAAAQDKAAAAAERAGVTISGPLGLCFLPAFICLGIVPVVVGLAGSVLSGGLI